MNITDINKSVRRKKLRCRRGRGPGSGLGKTAGRGQKGWGARAGGRKLPRFIGGQSVLLMRLPKRGFNNAEFRRAYVPVAVSFLEAHFPANAEVTPEALRANGVTLGRGGRVKILGSGDLSKSLQVKAHAFSKSAKAKIEKAGGTAAVIES